MPQAALSTYPVGALPPSRLSPEQLAALCDICGAANVHATLPDRLLYARDMWPRSVLWTLDGKSPTPPDAIVAPGNAREVCALLRFAGEQKLPVIPFGAGSGVCAGTLTLEGGLVIDLKRLNRLIAVDDVSLIAEIEPGIYGETLERELAPLGYTMGHFPSSIYCSTLGGYLAARSAGQLSSRYGKIEDMVVELEVALPDGRLLRSAPAPTEGLGLDWNQLIIGSEGTLGIITRAFMRVHRLPAAREFLAFQFKGVGPGLDAMRSVMRAGVEPAVLRLYDEFDTIVAGTHGDEPEAAEEPAAPSLPEKLVKEAAGKLKQGALSGILKRPGWLNSAIDRLPGKCLLVVMTEGEAELAHHEALTIRDCCLAGGGKDMGEGPARYWLAHRYSVSYKQSKIFAAQSWVDTMEVATTWRDVEKLYRAVKRAVADDAFIMAHFSHAYVDGCCIYFSFASAKGGSDGLTESHAKAWEHALAAVIREGGTITHHHGVGYSKGEALRSEYGALWGEWQALKLRLDPQGLMNPGKLGGQP